MGASIRLVKTSAERLRFHALQFPIAAIDSSYHVMPRKAENALWVGETPPGFVFNLKAYSMLTQHPTPYGALPRAIRAAFGSPIQREGNLYINKLPPAVVDQLWTTFAQSVQPLHAAGRLGAIVFQFPPWFHRRTENLDYIAGCRERLSRYRLTVEFRTGDWLNDEDFSVRNALQMK